MPDNPFRNGKRDVDIIVLHCSDSSFGDRDLIDKWHKERGFDCVGYHYVICNGYRSSDSNLDIALDGKIQSGRDLNSVGAHVKGFNQRSIGICLIGKTRFTARQFLALARLLRSLNRFAPHARIVGHNDLNPRKECPCFDVSHFINHVLYARKKLK